MSFKDWKKKRKPRTVAHCRSLANGWAGV